MSQAVDSRVWQAFQTYQHVYLATAEGTQPRVRPVTLIDLEQRFWIVTGAKSAKAAQIRKNPNVEFCLPLTQDDRTGYVRVAGVAEAVEDRPTRARIASQIAFFGDHWDSPDDPDFTLLRISRVAVEYLAPGATEAETFLV
jgi:general stress protein 26